jgi:hypothetical protein
MKAGRALSKAKFVERVASWAAEHDSGFSRSRLDEWIKQGLAFKADSGPGQGKRRTFTYGCRHYRRALQLVRFHSLGIRDTDEIIIQLFIRGYGVRPHEVREALRKEFGKARAKLNAQLRSTYADREGAIPPGRKKQFLGELGELDERFRKAGIIIPEDILIAAVRAARSQENCEGTENAEQNSDRRFGDPLEFGFHLLFGGMLEIGDDYETGIERTIRLSNDDEYEAAKLIFNSIRAGFFAIGLILGNSALGNAFRTAYFALPMREATALMLVTALKLSTRSD